MCGGGGLGTEDGGKTDLDVIYVRKINKNNFLKENSVTTSVRFTKSPCHFHKNCAPPPQTHRHTCDHTCFRNLYTLCKKGVCRNIYVLNCV